MSENNKIEIKDLFKQIFGKMYGYYYEREYIETISNFPLRTVMQYLKAYSDSTKKGQEINTETKKTFIQKNKDIFLNGLMNFGLDLEFFDMARGEKGIDLLTSKFIQKVSFEEIQDFKPYTQDQNKNITFILIPQYFNNYLKFGKYNEWGIKFLLPIFLKRILEVEIDGVKTQKRIEKNQKFFDNINQYCNVFDRAYKKLYILQPILAEKKFLVVQTYKRKDGLKKAIQEDLQGEKPKIQIENPLSIEDLRKEMEDKITQNNQLSLKVIYYSIPIIFVPFYEKGEKLAYLSPLEIINFLFLLLEDEEALKNFLLDKINAFFDEEIVLEDKNQEENHKVYAKFSIKDVFEELNDLISNWRNKIRANSYNMHLLEFNVCFSNYLSYTYDKLKIKAGKSVLEYIQIALLNFINEFIRNKLKEYGEPSKRLVSSTKPLFENLRRLAEISKIRNINDLEEFLNFIYLLLVSPAFYVYYTEEFKEKLDNFKLDRNGEHLIKNFIEETYNTYNNENIQKLKNISSSLERIIQVKDN